MITADTILKRGRTGGDEALLPRDEYIMRVDALRRALVEAELDALVVVDQGVQTGHVAYLAGPLEPKAAVILTRDGDPVVATDVDARSLPHFSSQTWIADIRGAPGLARSSADALAPIVGDLVSSDATIAVDGVSFDGHATQSAAALLGAVRRQKRPREKVVLSLSVELARLAVDEAARAYLDGASNADAAITADVAARSGGAHDARVLANIYGESLSPVERVGIARRASFSIYCAVEYLGYWSEACLTVPHELGMPANRALNAMVAACAPGVPTATVVAAAEPFIPAEGRALAASYGFGGGIGLTREEAPILTRAGTDELHPNDVLALHVVSRWDGVLSVASQTVAIGENEARVL